MKSLSDWLIYLETISPSVINLGLSRIETVAQKLGLMRFQCPVVTIGGTNGKGSCVAFLQEILLASDYRVGAYTSPHLLSFNERIKINGLPVEDEVLLEVFAELEHVREGLPLTFFEFTTLAALLVFKRANLDAILLEVGLGGRLDAVNAVESDIAVITSIDLDHVDWLGNSRESIGYEKAGIFRKRKPAVCGDPDPPLSLLQVAASLNTRLYQSNHDYFYQRNAEHWTWQRGSESLELPLSKLPLQNAATVVMVTKLLDKHLKIKPGALEQGIRQAELPGRFQQINRNAIATIFDVAHNPASAELLAERLQQEPCQGRTLAVVSVLADKDIPGTLRPLCSQVEVWHTSSLPVPRACSSEKMKQHLQDIGVRNCYHYGSINEAYEAALAQASAGDRIVVFGSFYTVASVLSKIPFSHKREKVAVRPDEGL